MARLNQVLRFLAMILVVMVRANGNLTAFPNIVWIYVENMDEINIIRNMSLNNIIKITEKHNYSLKIVTPETYAQEVKWVNQDEQKQRLQSLLHSNYLSKDIITKIYIKLTLLQKYGGIWLDLPIILVQNFDWLNTLKNQKYINNRIDDPQVVLFYQPKWFQETYVKTQDKVQDLVVHPHYYSWFLAAKEKSQFITKWRYLFMYIVKQTNTETSQKFMQPYGLDPFEYFLQQQLFEEWLYRAVITIKQYELDQLYGKQYQARNLAVTFYKITGIDATKSALVVSEQANYHSHLAVKYFTEMNQTELDIQYKYVIYLPSDLELQIQDILNIDYPVIQHLHTSVVMACDDQTVVPFRYVVKSSLLNQYLIKDNPTGVKVYDQEYIAHHCTATFLDVYYQFVMSYLLPLALLAFHIYVVRRAILIFKPQWGIRKQKRYLQQKA